MRTFNANDYQETFLTRVSPFSSPRHFDITKKSITELTLAAILLNAKNLVRERRKRKEPERQDESGTPERRYVEFSCVVSMSRGDILPKRESQLPLSVTTFDAVCRWASATTFDAAAFVSD